jgi:hypothetical protein
VDWAIWHDYPRFASFPHVEKGGVLEGHKDVLEAVRGELYWRSKIHWGETSLGEAITLGVGHKDS